VKWDLFLAPEGVPQGSPVWSTSTLSNTLPTSPKPGRYVIRGRVGLVSGETSIEVKPNEQTEAIVVLNGGVVSARAVAASAKPIAGGAGRRVQWTVRHSSGPSAGTNAEDYEIAVPPGRLTVQARLGNADVSIPVDVSIGEKVPVEMALGVGQLVVRAKTAEGAKLLSGVRWEVRNTETKQLVFGEGYFTESVYNLTAGNYAITGKLGNAVLEETVTVPVGESVVKEFLVTGAQ
jgi:hypothetical protein